MALYEGDCPSCGPFDQLLPLVVSSEPCGCPECGPSSTRVILTVPAILGMDSSLRRAYATNELGANAPLVSSAESRSHKQGPGCSCCSGSGGKSRTVKTANGGKTFPRDRPWMISH
jgi:putative FmdB family regulatory protein